MMIDGQGGSPRFDEDRLARIEEKIDKALEDATGWPETVQTIGVGILFLGTICYIAWLIVGMVAS